MPNETFHFSPFSLNPGVGLLFRDGAPVPLEPRAVKVLAYLVRSRGRVVPKEELLDKVWSGEQGAALRGAAAVRPARLLDGHAPLWRCETVPEVLHLFIA